MTIELSPRSSCADGSIVRLPDKTLVAAATRTDAAVNLHGPGEADAVIGGKNQRAAAGLGKRAGSADRAVEGHGVGLRVNLAAGGREVDDRTGCEAGAETHGRSAVDIQ